jgi:hypothetical protein
MPAGVPDYGLPFALALGIGANTTIFTLIHALILKSLPVANPQELVQIRAAAQGGSQGSWTYESFEFFRTRSELFSGVFAQNNTRFNVAFGEQATPVEGVFVSGEYFSTLGVQPLLGRSITSNDDAESGGPDGAVAVISHALWLALRRRPGDYSAATRVVQGTPVTIVCDAAPVLWRGRGQGSEPVRSLMPRTDDPATVQPCTAGLLVAGRDRPEKYRLAEFGVSVWPRCDRTATV